MGVIVHPNAPVEESFNFDTGKGIYNRDGTVSVLWGASGVTITGTLTSSALATGFTAQAATNLAKNDLVYISNVTNTGVPIVALAKANAAGKRAVFVVTDTVILSGNQGTVALSALSSANLDTSGAGSAGDPVYLSTTGTTTNTWTFTDPAAAGAITQIAGRVVVKDGAVGQIAWNLYGGVVKIGSNELQSSAITGQIIPDSGTLKFGTPGTDLVLTPDGTDVNMTGTGGLVRADNVVDYWGTGKDIGVKWDGSKLVVSQAAPNSAIDFGVDGAGIDMILRGDTASAAATWDQSADSLILSGVAKIKLQTIAAATGTAIPVTHSGSFPVTTAAAETDTLADPTFLGQTLTIFVDTYAVGDRVITAASRINQAGNTIITLGAVGDFIKLEAITIGGNLKWQVVSNDGAALS